LDKFHEITNSGDPVLVHFWAAWSGPSRIISPIFAELSRHPNLTNVKCYKVDLDEQQAIVEEVGIRSVPTFIVFHNRKKN